MKCSRKRASALSSALFFIALAILTLTGWWWPGVMLAVGIPLALRQFLLGRHHDALVSLFVFGGVFVFSQFNISWEILLPVLFVIAAVYILCREFLESKQETVLDVIEETEAELEEHDSK